MKTNFIFLILINLLLYTCSLRENEEIHPTKVEQSGKLKQVIEPRKNQIQFVHNFCGKKVILKNFNDTLMNAIVNSEYCKMNINPKNIAFELKDKWKEIEILIPENSFSQIIKIQKNKNINLYFHESSSSAFLKRDTIYILYWDENTPPFGE